MGTPGLEVGKRSAVVQPFPFRPSAAIHSPSFLPFLPLPFVSLPCAGGPFPQIQPGSLEKHRELASGSGRRPADKPFKDHSFMMALLQKLWDNQVHIVIRVRLATYQCDISQKTSGSMVSNRPGKYRYGTPFHTVPLPALSSTGAFCSVPVRLEILCKNLISKLLES